MADTGSAAQFGIRRVLALLAAAAVVLGGAMVVVGSFLPWSAGRDEPLFVVGWQGGDGGVVPDGSGMMAFAVLAAGVVMVVGGVLTGRNPTWWKGTLLAAVIAGVLGWGAFGTAVHKFGMFSHPPGFSFGEHLDVPWVGQRLILGGAGVGGIASLARWAVTSRDPVAA